MGPPQGGPCDVGSRPVPGGGVVRYCVPFGWSGLFRCLGAQRPGGPACPAGSPFLPRNGEKEGRGQAPWTPFFMVRSFPLAGFGVVGRIVPVDGLLRCPSTCPDLGRFFCAVFKFYARQPLPIHEPTPPSPPSWGAGRYGRWFMGRRPGRKKRGPPQGPPKLEKVGPGRKNLFLPGVLSSGFLPKKAGPPPGAGRATGRCAPRLRKSPDHPKGTQYPTAPRRGRRPLHVSGSGSPRMVASGWKMAQKKSLSRARISRSSR